VPEGHTIHRIVQDHAKLLKGNVVRVSSPQGRFEADAARIDGCTLEDLEAYGKHLFYWWSNGDIGHVHLGLFGKFRVRKGFVDVEPVGQVRMRLRTSGATIDLAGPTACTVGTPEDRERILKRLGPDPLRADAKPADAVAKMAKSKKPLGALLLDQSVLCGVGNVYRAEALFFNNIHPSRPGNEASSDELYGVWNTVEQMLHQGVKDNSIITVDRALLNLPDNGKVRRGDRNYVYHRDRCLICTSAIQTVELAGRPCYFCPTCQPR
jgi:endonuclease VIII